MILPNEDYANICQEKGIKVILTEKYQRDQYEKHKMNCETEGPKRGRGEKNRHLYWSPFRLIRNFIYEHLEFALVENYPEQFLVPPNNFLIDGKHYRFSMDILLAQEISKKFFKLDLKYWKGSDDIFISDINKYCKNNIILAPWRFNSNKRMTPYDLKIPEYEYGMGNERESESKWLDFFKGWYKDSLKVNRTSVGTEIHYQPQPLVDPNKLKEFRTGDTFFNLKRYYEKYPVKTLEPIAA